MPLNAPFPQIDDATRQKILDSMGWTPLPAITAPTPEEVAQHIASLPPSSTHFGSSFGPREQVLENKLNTLDAKDLPPVGAAPPVPKYTPDELTHLNQVAGHLNQLAANQNDTPDVSAQVRPVPLNLNGLGPAINPVVGDRQITTPEGLAALRSRGIRQSQPWQDLIETNQAQGNGAMTVSPPPITGGQTVNTGAEADRKAAAAARDVISRQKRDQLGADNKERGDIKRYMGYGLDPTAAVADMMKRGLVNGKYGADAMNNPALLSILGLPAAAQAAMAQQREKGEMARNAAEIASKEKIAGINAGVAKGREETQQEWERGFAKQNPDFPPDLIHERGNAMFGHGDQLPPNPFQPKLQDALNGPAGPQVPLPPATPELRDKLAKSVVIPPEVASFLPQMAQQASAFTAGEVSPGADSGEAKRAATFAKYPDLAPLIAEHHFDTPQSANDWFQGVANGKISVTPETLNNARRYLLSKRNSDQKFLQLEKGGAMTRNVGEQDQYPYKHIMSGAPDWKDRLRAGKEAANAKFWANASDMTAS